jgi:hypothetical protein
MRFAKILPFSALLLGISAAFAGTTTGNITSLRFVSGKNGIHYAVISTSSTQIVAGSQNYVGAEYLGRPYTFLVLPDDPTLCALAGASLERARSNPATKFYYNDVQVGPNSSMADVPGFPSNQWINLISDWYLGQ